MTKDDRVSLTIDGIKVETRPGTTILQASRETGIYIPTLCSYPSLPLPLATCRLCLVEVMGTESRFPSSCVTPVSEGMIVHTDTQEVQELRRHVFRALLSPLPSPRLEIPELRRLANYIGVREEDLPPYVSRNLPIDQKQPLFEFDNNRCILCGLCVRICKDVRGVGAIDFSFRGGVWMVGPFPAPLLTDNACRFCGACVEICPTGAIMDKDGKWPGYEVGLTPCTNACPAGIDAARYVYLIGQRRFAEAAAVIREKVPLPGVLGRVCTHPCEVECQRGRLNEPISIAALKRVAVERDARIWRARAKFANSTGKKVVIIGSGPAGLTAAYYLAKQGHAVTVFETLPEPGGMMRYGIPEYRLPREVLAKEIEEIKSMRVDIRTNTRISSVDELFEHGYHAIFLAIGAHQGAKLRIEGEDSPEVMEGVSFLREINIGNQVRVGDRVAVIGGGNVAVDASRSALRLGAKEVTIIYRRTRDEMPASREEIEEALLEGVKMEFLAAPIRIERRDGAVELTCIRMELGAVDESGRRRPVPIAGNEFTLPFDTVIAAIGQVPEAPEKFGLPLERGNTIQVDVDTLATTREGVFAGGDVVSGPSSVIEAIAMGRKAAASIDKYLGGTGEIDENLVDVKEPSTCLGATHGFAGLRRIQMPCLPVEKRMVPKRDNGFAEVELGLNEEMAIEEARRCLECQLRFQVRRITVQPG